MVKRLVLTVTSLGLAACGAAGPAKAPGPRAAALTPTVAEMVATVDGEPMPLVGAAAVSHGSSAVTVILSTHALPCSAFEASGRVTADGQRDIELSFSPRVQPDGALALVATEARVARRTLTDKAALKGLKLVGGDAGQPLQITADYAAKEAADEFLKRPCPSARR